MAGCDHWSAGDSDVDQHRHRGSASEPSHAGVQYGSDADLGAKKTGVPTNSEGHAS